MKAARQYLARETGLLTESDEQEKGVLDAPDSAVKNATALAV